ncbi:MAG: hypothetical protein WCO56_04940 [Verrucomicrobiota bacterium]
MTTPTCSQCGQTIPAEDVNVARNVAYCRACNLAHPLSEMVCDPGFDPQVDMAHPPAGTWYRKDGMQQIIGASHRALGTALGALGISLFWNGIVSVFVLLAISATLKHLGITAPDWFPIPKMNGGPMTVGMTLFLWLFLTPFMVIGAAMIGAFLSSLMGRTEVRLQGNEGAVFTGLSVIGWSRRFKIGEVKAVRMEDASSYDRSGRRQDKTNILIELNDGKLIKFGSSLPEERRQFLAAATRKTLVRR